MSNTLLDERVKKYLSDENIREKIGQREDWVDWDMLSVLCGILLELREQTKYLKKINKRLEADK
jgi:hypothetical protein